MSEPRIVYEDRPWLVRFLSHGWVQLVFGLLLGIIFARTLPDERLFAASLLLAVVALVMVLPQVNRRLPTVLGRLAATVLAVGVFAMFFFLTPDEEAPDTPLNQPLISNSKAVQGVSTTKLSSTESFLEALTSEETQKYSVSFSSDPQGAWLIIEGSALGQTPLTLDLPVGNWTYRLQSAEGDEASRAFDGVLTVSQDDSISVSLGASP